MVIPNRLPRGSGVVDKIVTREMKLGCWTRFLVLPRRVVCHLFCDSPEAMTKMISPKPERYDYCHYPSPGDLGIGGHSQSGLLLSFASWDVLNFIRNATRFLPRLCSLPTILPSRGLT